MRRVPLFLFNFPVAAVLSVPMITAKVPHLIHCQQLFVAKFFLRERKPPVSHPPFTPAASPASPGHGRAHTDKETQAETQTHTQTHTETHTNKTTLFSRTWSWPSLHRDGSSDPTLRRYARHCCTKQATSVLLSQRDVSLSRPLLFFFFFVFVGTTLSVIVTDHNSGNHRNLKR